MKWTVALVCLIATAALAQPDDEPHFKLDRAKKNVVELSNLSPEDEGCTTSRLQGKVVARSFDDDGVTLQTFTLEDRKGQRTNINIDDIQVRKSSEATKSRVLSGLQTLLKEGQRVAVGVRICGAGGRTLMADTIRPAGR